MDPLYDSSETESDEDRNPTSLDRRRGRIPRETNSLQARSSSLDEARRNMRQEFKLLLKHGVPYRPYKEVIKLKTRLRHLSQGKLHLHLHMKEQDSEVINDIIQSIKLEFGDKISDNYLRRQMRISLSNRRSYVLHHPERKHDLGIYEMRKVKALGKSRYYKDASIRNARARHAHSEERYRHHWGAGGYLGFAGKFEDENKCPPRKEDIDRERSKRYDVYTSSSRNKEIRGTQEAREDQSCEEEHELREEQPKEVGLDGEPNAPDFEEEDLVNSRGSIQVRRSSRMQNKIRRMENETGFEETERGRKIEKSKKKQQEKSGRSTGRGRRPFRATNVENNIGKGRGARANRTGQYKTMIENARGVLINHRNKNAMQQNREADNVRANESRPWVNFQHVPVDQSGESDSQWCDSQRMQLQGVSPTTINENLRCDLPRDAIKFLQEKGFGEEQFYFAYKDFTYGDFGFDGSARERFRTSLVGQLYVLYIRKDEIRWNRENSVKIQSIFGELEVYMQEEGIRQSSLYEMLHRYENEAEVEKEEFGSNFIATAQVDHEEVVRKRKSRKEK